MKNSMEIRETGDGSYTLYSPGFAETYHSVNGAITESMHVFIETGLQKCRFSPVNILEIGFGTGLNAFLALLEAERSRKLINYTSIEMFPVPAEIYEKLNYAVSLQVNKQNYFLNLHYGEWEREVKISPNFLLKKVNADITVNDFGEALFDVVFFDAFSPNCQPELWTEEIFTKIYHALKPEGILTTYCAKGAVRRNMQAVGFGVERLPGPPGKREMLRGIKK
jgi:tRNA U34 5-methylaminomethyl-2-thiouridine-forming methyltransferase MnmC